MVNVGTVIQANLTGYNLVLIASMENKFYQLVFVRPGITSLEQLKGKKLGHQRLRLDYPLRRAYSAQTSQSGSEQRLDRWFRAVRMPSGWVR